MTVQELIDELQKIKDKDQNIVVTTGYNEVSDNVCVNIEDCEYYACGAYIRKAVIIDLCHG